MKRLVEQEDGQATIMGDRFTGQNNQQPGKKTGGWEKRNGQGTARSTSRGQKINRALITPRLKSKDTRSILVFYTTGRRTSKTSDKIRVGGLSRSAGIVDVIIYVISEAQRREGKEKARRQKYSGSYGEVFEQTHWLLLCRRRNEVTKIVRRELSIVRLGHPVHLHLTVIQMIFLKANL